MVLLLQHYKWDQEGLEPWDYDPRRSAKISVDNLGYVGIITPLKMIQVLCKLLPKEAHT